MPHTQPVPATPLEIVNLQFKTWRDTRKHKGRIPDKLWTAAVGLSDQYSIHTISKALRVNHTALRDRIAACKMAEHKETHSCFIELAPPQSSPVSKCLVEMENRSGEKMRMQFTGKINLGLLELSRNFWERKS